MTIAAVVAALVYVINPVAGGEMCGRFDRHTPFAWTAEAYFMGARRRSLLTGIRSYILLMSKKVTEQVVCW